MYVSSASPDNLVGDLIVNSVQLENPVSPDSAIETQTVTSPETVPQHFAAKSKAGKRPNIADFCHYSAPHITCPILCDQEIYLPFTVTKITYEGNTIKYTYLQSSLFVITD